LPQPAEWRLSFTPRAGGRARGGNAGPGEERARGSAGQGAEAAGAPHGAPGFPLSASVPSVSSQLKIK